MLATHGARAQNYVIPYGKSEGGGGGGGGEDDAAYEVRCVLM
jgi:hypothetical protein